MQTSATTSICPLLPPPSKLTPLPKNAFWISALFTAQLQARVYQLTKTPLSSMLSIKYSSIKGYLAAVRHFHIRRGFELDLNKCLRLQLVCRGIKRSQGTNQTRVRLPITIKHLRLFHSLLAISYTSNYDSVRIWAAMTLAFFGFLRLGELTCNRKFSPEAHLSQENVTSSAPGKILIIC